MAPQLFVRNPDGKIYGPYTADSMRGYIAEGRVASPSLVRVGDDGVWMEVDQARDWLDAPRAPAGGPPPAPPSRNRGPSLPRAEGASAEATNQSERITGRDRRRLSYRGHSWIAAAACVSLALLLSYGLGVRASRCAPLYLLSVGFLVFGFLAPRATKGPLVTSGAKPGAPRISRASSGEGARPSDSDDDDQASRPDRPAEVPQSTQPHYARSDATGDMVLGGCYVLIGAVSWLIWFKAGAEVPDRLHRGLSLAVLPFFIFPVAGVYFFGRGLVWRIRERRIEKEQGRPPA